MKKAWPTQRLGDLFAFKNGRAFKKEEWATKGLPIIRIQNLNNEDASFNYFAGEYSRDILVEPGDLLFSWSGTVGSSFGSHLWNGEPGVLNQHIFKIGLRETIAKRYAFYGLRHITAEIEQSVNGSVGLVHITKEKLNEFTLPVPTLAEQQRIVSLLDEAFDGLAAAKANAGKNLQNARALFESHLQSVFTQHGPGWLKRTLGEIGKVSMCKRVFKDETTAQGDIPFYKIGTFGKEPDAFIPIQIYNEYRARYPFPKKGDVLISASGTIGRRVRYNGKPAYFQDSNIVWIANDERHVLNDYLFHFYSACAWNSTKGTTISRLYNDDLKRIAISIPESHEEQRRIVAQLNALSEETQRLARLYEQKLAALEALKKSILHQAFTGQL